MSERKISQVLQCYFKWLQLIILWMCQSFIDSCSAWTSSCFLVFQNPLPVEKYLEKKMDVWRILKKLRQLIHWGPIIALSIILFISLSTIKCMMMYWPLHAEGGIINFAIYMVWNFLTLYHYFLAVFKGPGFVPSNWKPVSNLQHLF